MCDFILFLGKDGRILEQGSFAELNADPNGKFAEFVRIQNLVDEAPKNVNVGPVPVPRPNSWKIVKDSLRQMFMLSTARKDPGLEDTAHGVEKLLVRRPPRSRGRGVEAGGTGQPSGAVGQGEPAAHRPTQDQHRGVR